MQLGIINKTKKTLIKCYEVTIFKITETFNKDNNALNLVDLLNKYIKSVLLKINI